MERTAHFMIVFFSFLLWIFVPKIYSVSLSVNAVPVSVDESQEADVEVTLYCVGCTSDSFLRAVFYSGGTRYFGFTQNNNSEWVNAPGGSCGSYFRISPGDLKEGSWSGKLKIKPDSASQLFDGPGEYLFKIARYTSSCNSITWSTEKTISITGPSPSPTIANTSTPTHTATPAPTNTPTMTQAPTSTLSPTLTPTPTRVFVAPVEFFDDIDSSPSAAEVLGATNEIVKKTKYTASPSGLLVKPYIIASLFIAVGLALLSGTLAWIKGHEISSRQKVT